MATRIKKKKRRLSFLILTFAGLLFKNAPAQIYILPNEELIYSFETSSGKKATLLKAKNNEYIVYRYGSKNKVELEFPEKNKSSWTKFTYSFYLRGGGPGNEGMDLNYVYFTNNNFKYIIYNTYYSAEEKQNTGIKIIDPDTKKITNIKGNFKTVKGTLTGFRDNTLLKIGEELFD